MIGMNLKYLRKKYGYSQEDLAERLEVSRQSVAKWENEESLPDVEKCVTMAQIFEQHRFKGAPVEPLEGQLSVFDQQDLLHVGQGPFLPSGIVKRRRRDRVRLRTSDRWDLSGRPDRWWDP